jgi:hypothetical protein
MYSSLPLLTFASAVGAISLWDPTGPYHVGYMQEILNHTTPSDPTSPGTFILITIYYPTLQIPNTTVPYLDPISAGIFEATVGLTPGSLSNLTTRMQSQAPTLLGTKPEYGVGTSSYPTLVFTPGAGLPTSSYTAYLSELTSYGYSIVAIDHPGEAPYLPLPSTSNGTKGVYGYPDFSNFPPTLEETFQVLNYRVSDIHATLDSFFLPFVQQYKLPFNTTHFGIFGHSIGGAAAVSVMSSPNHANAAEHKVGANLDGGYYQFFGEDGEPATNVSAPDLQRPFLELAAENHFEGNLSAEGGDFTWNIFEKAQTGWLRDVQINGTRHLDFSDVALWIDLLDQRAVLSRTWIGTANGVRVTHLANAMLRELFGSITSSGLDGVDKWIDEAPEFFVLMGKGF